MEKVRVVKSKDGEKIWLSVWELGKEDSDMGKDVVIFSWGEKSGFFVGSGWEKVLMDGLLKEEEEWEFLDYNSIWESEEELDVIIESMYYDYGKEYVEEFWKRFDEFKKYIKENVMKNK